MRSRNRTIVLRHALAAGGLSVDRDAGIIRGVAVITAGVTKVSGNGQQPFDVDAVTLQQVADSINATGGVKSRLTHPELDGEDPIRVLAGRFENARVDGNRVVADFRPGSYAAFSASGNLKEFLFGLAEDSPGDAGVSIVSETARLEHDTSTQTGSVLRVDRIDAVDWTGSPAANPAGMLSATKGALLMFTDAQIQAMRELGMVEGQDPQAFFDALTPEQQGGITALNLAEGEEKKDVAAAADEEKPAVTATEGEEKPGVATTEGEEGQKPAAMSAKAGNGVALSQADINTAVKAAQKAERERVKHIRGVALKCGYDETWINKQIESDGDIDDVNRVALSSLSRSPKDMPTSRVTVGSDRNRDTLNQAVQDAILLRANTRQFVEFDENSRVILSGARGDTPKIRQPHERSAEFRGHSLLEIGRRFLLSHGYDKADRMERPALASLLMSRSKLQAAMPGVFLAHATGDFPELLADSMGKVLRQEYALAPHTWNLWCNKTTAPDYKDIKKLQLSEAADMIEVPEGDDYTYTTLSEGKETYRLAKFGNGLKFTREMMINDDLSAFDRAPRILGRSARRLEETTAIGILTANATLADGTALFATGHSNLTTGVLTVDSLGAARALLRSQTALGSDDPLSLTPRYLLVPEAISITAEQLVSSTVDPSKSNATPNPFSNKLQVISSPRLDTTSAAQWYMLADPSEIDTVEVAFLEGEEAPVVEEEDEFDSDVRKMKVRHNIAAKAIDYRGMVRSSGA